MRTLFGPSLEWYLNLPAEDVYIAVILVLAGLLCFMCWLTSKED